MTRGVMMISQQFNAEADIGILHFLFSQIFFKNAVFNSEHFQFLNITLQIIWYLWLYVTGLLQLFLINLNIYLNFAVISNMVIKVDRNNLHKQKLFGLSMTVKSVKDF